MGLALEESIDELEKIESNGVTAYIATTLKEYASGRGTITIDYTSQSVGSGGFMVTLGEKDPGSCGFSC